MECQDARDLDDFVRTGSATAFESLGRRYARLVFGACLRRLGSPEDAEDASQAVFLVLARRARAVRPEHLASWLHEAAQRAASVTARARERRARHEQEAAQMRPAMADPPRPEWAEARRRLDAEVEALPGKLREAVARHYLAGQSHADLARELGVPEGTVASRVNAGLARLRERLARRGAVLGLAGLGALLAAEAQAAVPQTLLASFPHLATGVAAASAAGGAGVSVEAVVEEVLTGMLWAKVRMLAAVAAAGLVLAVAVLAVIGLAGDRGRAQLGRPRPADAVGPESGPGHGGKPQPAHGATGQAPKPERKIAVGEITYAVQNMAEWKQRGRIDAYFRNAPEFQFTVLDAAGRVISSTPLAAGRSKFETEFLAPGAYKLQVAAKGYSTLQVENLSVRAGNDLVVSLVFEGAPGQPAPDVF